MCARAFIAGTPNAATINVADKSAAKVATGCPAAGALMVKMKGCVFLSQHLIWCERSTKCPDAAELNAMAGAERDTWEGKCIKLMTAGKLAEVEKRQGLKVYNKTS